jgi:hypothetical protein
VHRKKAGISKRNRSEKVNQCDARTEATGLISSLKKDKKETGVQKLLLRINESRKVPLRGVKDETFEQSLNSVRLDYQVDKSLLR